MGNVYVSLHETSQPKLSTLKGHTPYNAAALTESVMKVMVKKVRERVPGAADLDEDGTLAQLNAEIEDALLVYMKKLTAPPTELMISGSGIFSSSDLILEMTCPPHPLSGNKLRLHVDWKAIKARVKGSGKIAATEKSTGIKVLTVLSHKDIGPMVRAKLSKPAREAFKELKIPVEVEITDTTTLKLRVSGCGGNPLLLQKISDSADFQRLVDEVAAVAEEIYTQATHSKDSSSVLEVALQGEIEDLVIEAAMRATAAIQKSAQIRLDRKKYVIKSTIKLALNVSGTALGVASLAVSGVSGGVTGVYSLLKVVQSIANTALLIRDLGRSADEAAAAYQAAFKKTQALYEKATSKGGVGAAEVFFETTSALMLTENALPSIATSGRLLEQWGGKVWKLVISAEDQSKQITVALDTATQAKKQLEAALAPARTSDPSLAGVISQLIDKIKALEKKVNVTIAAVQKMHKDSSAALDVYERNAEAYETFKKDKKPPWADVVAAMSTLGLGVASIAQGASGLATVVDKVALANDLVTLAVDAHGTAADLAELAKSASQKR